MKYVICVNNSPTMKIPSRFKNKLEIGKVYGVRDDGFDRYIMVEPEMANSYYKTRFIEIEVSSLIDLYYDGR